MKRKPGVRRERDVAQNTKRRDTARSVEQADESRSSRADEISSLKQIPFWPAWVPRERFVFLAAVLFICVLGLFLPALGHEFICYDDNGYVTDNPWVKNGLTWSNVVHAFRTTELAYWHPLTWISHLVDIQLFGQSAWGHHLTSVLWHALNAVLVFAMLYKMTGALGRSWFVAALFALHPLHVESVAWVAERKDLLSTFFAFLAIFCYVKWTRRKPLDRSPATKWYFLSILFFAAGLMSKPMVVTLPCLLLLLDYWPLNRWNLKADGPNATSPGKLLIEKIPFMGMAAVACFGVIRAQSNLGALDPMTVYPWFTRVNHALVSYLDYLEKCFLPAKLAVFYPYPNIQPIFPVIIAGTILTAVTIAAITWRKTKPYLFVGWFWFLGTLVPVIGLVQAGAQAMADRYSYVPLIGIFIAAVWGVAEMSAAWKDRSWLLGPAAAGLLAVLAVVTNRQLSYWQNSLTLFSHALTVTENNWCAHFCLGYYYAHTPSGLQASIAEYRDLVQLAPDFGEGHFSLAAMLARQPDTAAEAVREYQTALQLSPGYTKAHYAMARALEQIPARQTEMIAEYETAVKLKPDDVDAHFYLGNALSRLPGRLNDAVTEYRIVLQLRPEWIEIHSNLGTLFAQMPGRISEAVSEYEILLRARPEIAETHNNLANVLAEMPGRSARAIAEYETAIRLRPDFYQAEFNLGNFLSQFPNRIPEAITHFKAALRVKPDLEPARIALERLRAAPAR